MKLKKKHSKNKYEAVQDDFYNRYSERERKFLLWSMLQDEEERAWKEIEKFKEDETARDVRMKWAARVIFNGVSALREILYYDIF